MRRHVLSALCGLGLIGCMSDGAPTVESTNSFGSGSGWGSGSGFTIDAPPPPVDAGSGSGSSVMPDAAIGSGSGSACDGLDLDYYLQNCDTSSVGVQAPDQG